MENNTYCIIMAGGYGSRFWPICRDDSPKQFIDILGNGRSMLQTTFDRFAKVCPRENIIIVTHRMYESRVREQIAGLQPWQVLGEPIRRNTAPCVAYAAAIIYEKNPDANIIVTPADHAIFDEDCFVRDVEQALALTDCHDCVVTIGVRPNTPNVQYGYIQFSEEPAFPQCQNLHKVITFTEKPPLQMARQFIATGEFFWNTGVYVWKMSTLRSAYERFLPNVARGFFGLTSSTTETELDRLYSMSEAISVDFGIMEHAENVYVMEASFRWSDIESWDSLFCTAPKDTSGNGVVMGRSFLYGVKNTLVHVPQNRTVVLQGLDGYIVAANEDTILVCRREEEDLIAKFASDVELENQRIRK
ncbi:MAG: mannose-1-phosphate guanylyltransferase [Bacteroidales bacterium]|nr:mannose-1-phosphate guanylyltransferase [Bacteroidales bacterium]